MALMDEPVQNVPVKSRQSFSIDLRLVVALLLLVIGAMFILWKPWASNAADARTIEVRGEATLTARPDEFVFYPSYKFENADKNTALAELTKKSDEIVAKLKELGVPENKIKTTSNGGAAYGPEPSKENDADTTYSLQLTITVNDDKMTQKVQDYLASTTPIGSISPQANFSDTKRKELEDKARVEALKDGKTKADQSAKELGFKVGKVKAITDGSFAVFPGSGRGMTDTSGTSIEPSLGVHSGENELPYSVTIVYFID